MARARKSESLQKESHAFKDLKAMPCFEEMDKKVKAGIALEDVAVWLQDEMFQQQGIKRDSLVRKLFRYKASLPPAELVKEPPLYVQKAIEKLRRGVHELDELEKLYLLQLKRISIDAETETKINKLFSSTGGEIRLAADLLGKMVSVKMDLGLLDRTPTQVNVSGNVGLSAVADEDLDESAKAKLGMLAGRLLNVMSKSLEGAKPLEEDIVDVEYEDDL